jgi:predicted lipoprotein with Yx(FWY)xxD motif
MIRFLPALAVLMLAGTAVAQTADAPLTTRLDAEEGEYLVAGNGYSLYLFKADRQGSGGSSAMSACEGDCLATWPPLIVDAVPMGSGNVASSLLGTMERTDGTLQATYNGWPLYFYAEDIEETDINGHDIESFGEDWYLIGPNGNRARD